MGRELFDPLNTTGLPPELLKELGDKKRNGDMILAVMKAGGGCLNTKEMMIGLWQMYGVIRKRSEVQSDVFKLHRDKRVIKTGKKGEYRLVR